MKERLYSAVSMLLLPVSVVIIFFGEILWAPGQYYFTTGGDGFKSYYGALYHARYDEEAFRSNGMNYPYGEGISFTDSQPLLVNPVRFISKHIIDISEYTVAFINLAMLFSIVLGVIFIYLIFREIGVVWWYASPAATGIAMLSPQIGRMAGHFGLSWLFWIPLLVYLVIRFDRTRKVPYTILIGLVTFCAGLMHFYFVAIIGFLIGGYWFFRFIFYRHLKTFWYRDILHIFFQFVIPVLVLQFLTLVNDDVTDRTAWPFGLFSYLAHPVGIFLPDKKPWLFVPANITVFRHISWESLGYIGTPALVGFLAGWVWIGRRISLKQSFLKVTHLASLNVMFWVSVIALLFSFGLPMVLGMKELADYLGPLRQLRALGRFSWLFFYLLNIVVFAGLYHRAFRIGAGWYWKALTGLAFLILFTDGFYNVRNVSAVVKNRIPALEDTVNETDANKWIGLIEPARYQAIVPLPYFHVGSENIWIDATHGVKEATLIASVKTGLPTVGVELSRTSISQTYNNYALFTEPLERLEFTDFLPDERPFLLLVMNGYSPAPQEQRMVEQSELITETPAFRLYELTVPVIRRLNLLYQEEVILQYSTAVLTSQNGWEMNKPGGFFIHQPFDELQGGPAFEGTGALSYPSRQWQTIWQDTLHQAAAGTIMLVSFWVRNYRQDGYLRGNIEFFTKNPANDETTFYFYSDLFRHIKAFSGDWALIEFAFETKGDDEVAKLSVRNGVLPKAEFVLDELVIREQGLDVYRKSENRLWYNNRTIPFR